MATETFLIKLAKFDLTGTLFNIDITNANLEY